MDLFLNNEMLNDISKEVSFRQQQQNIIASNIANVDTPKYKAMKVVKVNKNNDKNNLNIKTTHNAHFSSFNDGKMVDLKIVNRNNYIYDNTGNDVNLDEEKIDSSVNAMKLNASINAFKKYTTSKKTLIDSISRF